jgi:molecular chaperone GrpE
MSYMYDPRFRRPYAAQAQARRPGGRPTLEDFERLATAYRELQAQQEVQSQQVAQAQQAAREVAALKNEVAIKDEALKRQGEDLKRTQSELLWTQAALRDAQQEMEGLDQEGWRGRYERLQAEVDDLRRRWEQRAADETAEARRAILRDMLPLADHLEMALSHREAVRKAVEGEPGQQAVSSFMNSIETTLSAFLDALRRYGVERQEPQGRPFDPAQHEAVGRAVIEGVPEGHVAHVVRSGYMEGDTLLRPARVIVSQ